MSGDPSPRIAYLVSRFPKVSETFVAREAAALQDQGCEVAVFAINRESAPIVQPEAARLMPQATFGRLDLALLVAQLRWLVRHPVVYLGTWFAAVRGNLGSRRFLLRALVVVPVAARWALEMPADGITRVHAHFATHAALAGWVVNRLTGIPFSFTVHAHDLYVDRTMLVEKVRAADVVVTISEFNRRLLRDVCGAELVDRKVRVVRCGVDASVFGPHVHRPAHEPRRMVCVGTLEHKKGQVHLVRAVGLLRDRGHAVEAVLVGEGDTRAELEAEVSRLRLESLVRLPGAADRRGVLDALESADVVVLPSVIDERGRMEGIPVSLMEAMAVGVPVISTDISGIPELVRDGVTGLLVAPGSPEQIADAFERLVCERGLAESVADAAATLVADEYDLAANVARLARLLGADAGEIHTAQRMVTP